MHCHTSGRCSEHKVRPVQYGRPSDVRCYQERERILRTEYMFLTVRRHAGNSRPGTGSVVRCEWRFQFSLIRENQCGGHEHVITLKSDNSSVWLSHDCSQSCAHRCSELWYAPSPDSQHVPALAESRCHHYAPATPPAPGLFNHSGQ